MEDRLVGLFLAAQVGVDGRGADLEDRRGGRGGPEAGLLAQLLHPLVDVGGARGEGGGRGLSRTGRGSVLVVDLLVLADVLLDILAGAEGDDARHEGEEERAHGDVAVPAPPGQPELQLLLQAEVLVGRVRGGAMAAVPSPFSTWKMRSSRFPALGERTPLPLPVGAP